MTEHNTDWIADKLLAQEEKLDEALKAYRDKQANAVEETSFASSPQQPVPVDPEAEKQTFAELLALMATPDAGEAGTVVDALDLAGFAEDSFSPTERDNPNPTA